MIIKNIRAHYFIMFYISPKNKLYEICLINVLREYAINKHVVRIFS